jgi:hypothetical protein
MSVAELRLSRFPSWCVRVPNSFRAEQLRSGRLGSWAKQPAYGQLRTVQLQCTDTVAIARLVQPCTHTNAVVHIGSHGRGAATRIHPHPYKQKTPPSTQTQHIHTHTTQTHTCCLGDIEIDQQLFFAVGCVRCCLLQINRSRPHHISTLIHVLANRLARLETNVFFCLLVFIKTNPVYGRRVNSFVLVCSLSSHRHLFIPLIFGSRFIDS